MPLILIEKSALTPEQTELIEKRLSWSEHQHDLGPVQVWSIYSSGLFAFFEEVSGQLVALVEASGLNDVQPGWWVDSAFRDRGYGGEVIDLLALHLKARGVTRIGQILITTHQQQYNEQSSKLAQRLKRHFE